MFDFEITLTEDRPNDIKAALGRSDHRSPEIFHKEHPRASSLQGNVVCMITSRISAKLKKDYGPNTALVIRDSSPGDHLY